MDLIKLSTLWLIDWSQFMLLGGVVKSNLKFFKSLFANFKLLLTTPPSNMNWDQSINQRVDNLMRSIRDVSTCCRSTCYSLLTKCWQIYRNESKRWTQLKFKWNSKQIMTKKSYNTSIHNTIKHRHQITSKLTTLHKIDNKSHQW
jgi:hypothetical protein